MLLLLACASAPELPTDVSPGDTQALEALADWQAEGLLPSAGGAVVLGVYQDGAPVLIRGGGALADGSLPDETTRFRVGSVSKLVTAVTVLALHEQGALDLDAPVDMAHLPGVTPRHLLSHHAGVQSDWIPGMYSERPLPLDAYPDLLADAPPIGPAGTWWSYSNLGYTLLGSVIEDASGASFEQATQALVFDPCAMPESGWDGDTSVRGALGGAPYDEALVGTVPAAGLVSTVSDLAAFAHNLGQGCAVSPELLAEAMTAQHVHPMDLDLRQGLGFELTEPAPWLGDHRAVGHSGDSLVFHADVRWIPALDVVAVALTNQADAGSMSTATLQLLQLAVAAQTGHVPEPLPETGSVRGRSTWTSDELDGFVGVYGTQIGVLDIRRVGGVLRTELMGHGIQLAPTDTGTFVMRPLLAYVPLPVVIRDLELSFHPVDDQVVIGIRGPGPGPVWMPLGSTFEPMAATGAWADRVGTWVPADDQSHDLLTLESLEIHDDDGTLVAQVELVEPADAVTLSFGLLPVDDTRAVTAGTSRRAGEAILADDDTLIYAGVRFVRAQGGAGCAHSPGQGWGLALLGVWLLRRRRLQHARASQAQ